MADKAFIDLDKLFYNNEFHDLLLSVSSFFVGAGVVLILIGYDNCHCDMY